MKIFYFLSKGLLRFDCLKKEWRVFYPDKKIKARREGAILSQDQVRCLLMNYKMKNKPMVHRGL